MWHWTLKSLFSDTSSLLASVATTASAFLLVLVFEAVYEGEAGQVVAYLEHSRADVWVMQRGVSNMHMATSYLADEKIQQVRRVPGVATAEGILYLNTVVTTGSKPWFAFVVGLDAPESRFGPWAMAAGESLPAPGEAVVPEVFAEMSGLGLGDRVRVAGRDFVVSGLSDGTFSMANSVLFITKQDLEEIMSSLEITSYIGVEVAPGSDPARVADEIERTVDKVAALTAGEFIENDRRLAVQMGVETIALMTLIGGALAVLLVAFAVFSRIARQRRELALAKALGVTNRALFLAVAAQALFITLASVLLAIVLAILVMPAATALIPQLTLQFTPASAPRIALVGAMVALLAAWMPARQVARVDPLTVFQA